MIRHILYYYWNKNVLKIKFCQTKVGNYGKWIEENIPNIENK